MRLLSLVLGLLLALGCHRNVEPYDPNEGIVEPDLSRIFPEGADRAEEGAPVMGAAPRPSPPTSSDAEPLRGTIRLAEALADRVPPGAVLFLIARTSPEGPPSAVKRISDPNFPLEFALGPSDRMIQATPFAGPFQLSVRIDADGNAMTRNPGDLQGRASGSYEPGTDGIELLIDEIL
ncbi:MAG: hypothetical protein GY723_03010 [bacterium]|nr:hypothetical protein [bacterium]